MKETVGLVGVGLMGANMARRLHEVGYPLSAVYDVMGDRAQTVGTELGCRIAANPAEVAEQSAMVLTVVTDDRAMRTLFSPEDSRSLLAHAEGRLFVNCATVSPQVHEDIEPIVEAAGGQSLEACMASSIAQARAGTLYLMCGGKPEAFERAQPLLQLLSADLRYLGAAGQAATVKVLVNMVMNINTAGLAEGLGLGAALGVDLTILREVFSQTGAASRVLETDGADMQHRDHDCYFSAEHAAKDSGLANRLAESAGVSVPLSNATLAQYQQLVTHGKGTWDKSAVSELTFKGRLSS